MKPTIENIYQSHTYIMRHMFQVGSTLDYLSLVCSIGTLADDVHAFEGETDYLWSIGECSESSLPDLLVGAYWHLTEWHGGQTSTTYDTMCQIGNVFNPGMSCVEPENDAYQMLNEMAETYHAKK